MRVRILQLPGTSAAVNLATEEFLARHRDEDTVTALLYRNATSVIMGRNQNPWLECDPEYLRRAGIPLLRRISGGGTVYHDLGNLNYSLILPRSLYCPEQHVDMVCAALRSMGVQAEQTDRNDIALHRKKISGTAYMLSGRTALHHGSLLVQADLDVLKKCLRTAPGLHIETRAILSVRAEVDNIRRSVPGFEVDCFVDAFHDQLAKLYGSVERGDLCELEPEAADRVSDYLGKYGDPEWTFGRTPPFTAEWDDEQSNKARIEVRNGRVTAVHGRPAAISKHPSGQWFNTNR